MGHFGGGINMLLMPCLFRYIQGKYAKTFVKRKTIVSAEIP